MVKSMNNSKRVVRIYLVCAIVTVAALLAMIGVNRYTTQSQLKSPLAQQEEIERGENADNLDGNEGSVSQELAYDKSGFDDYTDLYQKEEVKSAMADRGDMYDETIDGSGSENTDGTVIDGTVSEDAASVAAVSEEPALSFGKSSFIQWPVSGNVLMKYSMDQTIYHATLDQYKYNPAIIIEAAVNDKVLAGAPGKIADIETNENTGLTVTVDLGDGYQAIYGQLKEVKAKEGDTLKADTVLGYIAEPTKYYSLEGANLYFAMTKDGEPVNPMEYLK